MARARDERASTGLKRRVCLPFIFTRGLLLLFEGEQSRTNGRDPRVPERGGLNNRDKSWQVENKAVEIHKTRALTNAVRYGTFRIGLVPLVYVENERVHVSGVVVLG